MVNAVKQENKELLKKYGICFGVASVITFLVFWIKGFFTHSVGVNIQILSDGFYISGMMMLFVAGMMYVSGEGALIGIGYVMKSVVQFFVPMGRKYHETYADYRERKIGKAKPQSDSAILVTGLIFFLIGIIFAVIWYTKFYNAV